MGKFVFNEYHIKLQGKEYDVLVPSVNITEMWAFPMQDLSKCDNWDVIEGNRLAMQWVRNAWESISVRYCRRKDTKKENIHCSN